MARKEYPNPPVHEVILDLRLKQGVSEEVVRSLPEAVPNRFGDPRPFQLFQLQAGISSTGAEQLGQESSFGGWIFEAEEPRWVLRTLRDRLTLHAARPGDWPKGEYVGWGEIQERFREVFDAVAAAYAHRELKRIGLRYQNRIAIPEGSDLGEWFNLRLEAPEVFGEVYSFNLRQTWGSLSDFDGLSSTVNLARISVEDPELAENHIGVLLDIDVFNLMVDEAPTWNNVLSWYSKAHEAENRIFEGCVTDQLRKTFREGGRQ